MDLEDHLNFDHLFLYERKCRSCGQTKNLIDGFYRTRKDRGPVSSSFSYECKECTKNRIITTRKNIKLKSIWEYPDW
jgi:predicted nucleic acid-binding Zn ribbon protein